MKKTTMEKTTAQILIAALGAANTPPVEIDYIERCIKQNATPGSTLLSHGTIIIYDAIINNHVADGYDMPYTINAKMAAIKQLQNFKNELEKSIKYLDKQF